MVFMQNMGIIVISSMAILETIFTVFVLLSLKGKGTSTSLLAYFFIFVAVDLAVTLLRLLFPTTFGTLLPINPFVFAYGAVLLIYLRTTLLKAKTYSIVNLLHFIPFLFFLSLSIVLKDAPYSFTMQYYKVTTINRALLVVYTALSWLSIFVYSSVCWGYIGKAKQNIEDYYSFDKAEKLIYWFKYLTLALFIMYTVPNLIGIMSVISKNNTFDTNIIYPIGYTFISLSTIYFVANRSSIFVGNERDDIVEVGTTLRRTSYTKSQIPIETLEKCAKNLKELMETKKVYLQSDLSLDDTANMLNVPKHYITQSLNLMLHKNFYLFVNEYRVKEFKERLSNPENKNFTLLSIAYDSGFNSKSTFNNIFKKFTGRTPTEYYSALKKKTETEE